MNAHLAATALAIAPRAHAGVILDRAGWPACSRLEVPHNAALLARRLRAPELNPVENEVAVRAHDNREVPTSVEPRGDGKLDPGPQ